MSTRPHLHPGLVLAVAAGGAVGSVARGLLGSAVGAVDGWPLGTMTANLVGSFLLGLLLEALLRRGPETPRARLVRLALGTGTMGGFTTFSSLALEIERLLADGSTGVAVGYAAATVVLGLASCAAGVVVGARLRLRRALRGPAS
ncbi:CrcB family protein [Isoptericola sp. b490]|uniref:fluoride efflux transporter FluC n=1 Tax=Actinotalea lenta TaxID=3064654 RepID=UPI002714113B|nr:CrcB family protein [Isoptericola sp. b490]MDO8121080.1 CrcB family protein [Isoptericola sp. b490]